MKRAELVQEVERDFSIVADFARVSGLNAEMTECLLRLHLKVRGLYPRPPRQPKEWNRRPKGPVEPMLDSSEPVLVDASTRWG